MRARRLVIVTIVAQALTWVPALKGGPQGGPQGVSQAWAFSGAGWFGGLGDPLSIGSPRTLGAGNAVVTNEESGLALFHNPAGLRRIRSVDVQVSGLVLGLQETRSFPVFDTFAARMAETHFVNNDFARGAPQASLGFRVPGVRALALGAGFSRAYDFNYRYDEAPRNVDNSIMGRNVVGSTGSVNQIGFGVAWAPVSWAGLGASVALLQGDAKWTATKSTAVSVLQTATTEVNTTDMKGTALTVGVQAQPFREIGLPWVDLGASVRLPYDLTGSQVIKTVIVIGTTTTSGSASRSLSNRIPATYQIGARLRPPSRVASTILLELAVTPWAREALWSVTGSTSATGSVLELQDQYEYRLGLEQALSADPSQWPIRLGLIIQQAYSRGSDSRNASARASWVTVGTGFSCGRVGFDIAGAFGKREYQAADLFVNSHGKLLKFKPGNLPDARAPYETGNETLTQVQAALRYSF